MRLAHTIVSTLAGILALTREMAMVTSWIWFMAVGAALCPPMILAQTRPPGFQEPVLALPGIAPTNVRVRASDPRTVRLDWAPAPDSPTYWVHRATGAATAFYTVGSALSDTTAEVVGVLPGTVYRYKVSAQVPGRRLALSEAVSLTMPAAPAPSTLTATITPAGSGPRREVLVAWSTAAGADGYRLRQNGAVLSEIRPMEVNGRLFLQTTFNTEVGPGVYRFQIQAVYRESGTAEVASDLTLSPVATITILTQRPGEVPSQGVAWLSKSSRRLGAGSIYEAQRYYESFSDNRWRFIWEGEANFGIKTLDDWKKRYGFGKGDELRAVYFNGGDLALGRDMYCREEKEGGDRVIASIACYVANHGPEPGSAGFPNAAAALSAAVTGRPPFATVAMSVSPDGADFFAYGPDGRLANQVVLDSEGPKSVPQVCMSCHGGVYDSATSKVRGASFLPFDVFTFQFSDEKGFRLEDQQEVFRKLNALVKRSRPNSTNPHNPIGALIDGMYPDGVDQEGSRASDAYVPPGWAGKPNIYDAVVKRYCRTCHLALEEHYDFTSERLFTGLAQTIQNALCYTRSMPHAEVPFRKLWQSTLPYLPGYLEDPSVLGVKCVTP